MMFVLLIALAIFAGLAFGWAWAVGIIAAAMVLGLIAVATD